MKITQLRNATILLEANGHGIIVDPMLSPQPRKSVLDKLAKKILNPITNLPLNSEEVLSRATSCLITHCQKGHYDHLDRTGIEWLRKNSIPVFCEEGDEDYLKKKGLVVECLKSGETNEFLGGDITPIPCVHGKGITGWMTEHGFGYVIRLPGQPTLYLSGDTVLTDDVKACLNRFEPDVSVIPAGGSNPDLTGETILNLDEVVAFGKLSKGIVVANHMESLDHCPVTRSVLRETVTESGIETKFRIPDDGETLEFNLDA